MRTKNRFAYAFTYPAQETDALPTGSIPLPSGTVTFLFTDVEASTRLWEQAPAAMRVALARHDALLRQTFQSHDGYVFKTMGDAFCVAFVDPAAALQAALDAQRALLAESWPESAVLRVRMALHAGACERRDEDYFGAPLNRVARLLSIAHGGQTILSQAVHTLTRDAPPLDVTFRDAGPHRLRDLQRPEQVYQLLHPALPADFPPLRSLDNPQLPNNLPRQLTSFIGREKEIEEVRRLLTSTCLLTLTGSGGCGKTRLALQVAADLLDEYSDGVWLVELASLADPNLVPQTVASALNVREVPGRPLIQTLSDSLRPKEVLLLLDNCEHLLVECAPLATALLQNCPNLRILATSREGLGIAGETTYRVPSLSLPDPNHLPRVENLSRFEAVHLFMDRAMAAVPTFTVTDGNAPALACVCNRLDGIPLAIELASARVRALSVEEINARLDQCFRLLTGGSRTALARHQTLHAMIDWSYNLLNVQEAALLRRLSVFAGGWVLAAAEAVCSDEKEIEGWEVLDLLSSLVDKSLAVAELQAGATRYRLLETTRQYAREKLKGSGEEMALGAKHRDFFLALAEEAYEKRMTDEAPALTEILEREHDNCRAALDFCTAGSDAEAHLRLAGALAKFWEWRGYYREGRARLAAALSRPDAHERSAPRARALNGAAILAIYQNDPQAARPLFVQSAEIWRALGEKGPLAIVQNNLGVLERQEQHYDLAQACFEQCLALMRELNDRAGISLALINIGYLARVQNDLVRARPSLEEGTALSRETGNLFVLEAALSQLAHVAMQEGDYATARAQYREALALMAASRNEENLIEALEPMAELAARLERMRHAVRLFAASAAMRERIGTSIRPYERADYGRREQLLRAALDEETFAEEWAAGFALTTEEAIALAQEIL